MTHACGFCGKPTDQFCTVGDERRYMHVECMITEGQKLIDSGAVDDVRIVTRWPDGPTQVASGRTLRKSN